MKSVIIFRTISILQCIQVECNICLSETSSNINSNSNDSMSSSDYRIVFKHDKVFVDKTLLIKDFLSGPPVTLVTAPPRFGKTTVIDMIRRFVGINVDGKGNCINPYETENYKLFCTVPLNICKNKMFVEEHFGRYPVLLIDLSWVRDVRSYTDMLTKMRKLLAITYSQYRYLLGIEGLWCSGGAISKKKFHDYLNLDKELHEVSITNGFGVLLRLLYGHFGEPVIILIDEFNVHLNNLIFKMTEDIDRVKDYFISFSKNLVQFNPYMSRAFLSGIHHSPDLCSKTNKTNTFIYEGQFLGNDNFSEYYVFTEEEVNNIVERNVENNTERKYTTDVISEYYGGYTIQGKTGKYFSIPSIIKFFENNMTTVNYWPKTQSFFNNFAINLILPKIRSLIMETGYVYTNVTNVLSSSVIDQLHNIQLFGSKIGIEWILHFLYDLGFLTSSYAHVIPSIIPLKIPNKEVHMEFCSMLKENHADKYNYSLGDIENLQKAVDLFRPGPGDIDIYVALREAVQKLFHNSNHHPITGRDVQYAIFIYLAEKFPAASPTTTNKKSMKYKVTEKLQHFKGFKFVKNPKKTVRSKTPQERLEIIVINSHRMAFVVDTVLQKIETEKKNDSVEWEIVPHLERMAQLANKKSTTVYQNYISNTNTSRRMLNHTKGVVYVGIGFEKTTRNISLAISTSFTKDVLAL